VCSTPSFFISSFEVRGDSLFAGTFGAGVYVRSLLGSGGWSHFGEVFEPEQASNVNTLALGNGRLLAAAGSNGSVFWRDRTDVGLDALRARAPRRRCLECRRMR
jgi:hypothetical protein